MKIHCFGLTACDVPLYPIPKDIMHMEACFINKPVMSTGGDALNVAVTLQKLGATAGLSCLIGNDSYGDFVYNSLSQEGVSTDGVIRHPEIGTTVSYILIDEDGQRRFVLYDELQQILSDSDISDELICNADLVYYGSVLGMKNMDNGGAANVFKKARSFGKMTVADAKGVGIYGNDINLMNLLEPTLRVTDVFAPSYDEAVYITGKQDLSDICKDLSKFGLKHLVIKLGDKGSYITDFLAEKHIPAFKISSAIDTTGAGDSFVGGLIFGLLKGWSLESSAIFGNAVASFNVQKVGATAGVPDFGTALKFVKQAKCNFTEY